MITSLLWTDLSVADYCRAKGGPVKGPGQNKFLEMSSPLLPPAIPVWRDALAAVDTTQEIVSLTRLAQLVVDICFLIPDYLLAA